MPVDIRSETLHDRAIIIGYGRVGRVIGELLSKQPVPFVVVEQDRNLVQSLRRRGVPAI